MLSEPEVKSEDVVTGIGNGEVSIDLGQYGFYVRGIWHAIEYKWYDCWCRNKIGTEIKNTRSVKISFSYIMPLTENIDTGTSSNNVILMSYLINKEVIKYLQPFKENEPLNDEQLATTIVVATKPTFRDLSNTSGGGY